MAKGSGPIQYNELFNNDVDAKLAELSGIVNKLDADFQGLATTISGMTGKIAVNIKTTNTTLEKMAVDMNAVDVATRGAGDKLQVFSTELETATTKSRSLKEQQEGLKKVFDISTASVDQIKAQIKLLTTEYASLGRVTDADKAKLASLSGQVVVLKNQQETLTSALNKTKTAIVAADGSYTQMSQRLAQLKKDLLALPNAFDPATGALNKSNTAATVLQREISQLDTAIKKADASMGVHGRNVGNYSGALGSATSQLSQFAAGYLSIYAGIAAVQKIVSTNAEISDSMADVRRTASLTDKEVNNLVETLKKIDTRTSLKGLLDIAVIGGQLGIAKDQLAGFTKAIDQLSVTLSGEIQGGAEAVASALGKINGVFKVQQKEGTDVETSFNKTGSAILALGQAGLATGEFLQDFGLRVAGVANTAKISLPTVLAYGAVLEETGSSAEVAGTALSRLIGNLAVKRDKFFAIAKISDATLTLKSFTDLINKDANAALQKFFAGLNAGGKDLTSFSDLINEIGIKGGPAKNAIIALAQNQGLLNERIGESVEAYNKGTLSAEQFAIKNDTLGASISKLGNTFLNLVTSGGIGKFFKNIVDGLTNVGAAIGSLTNSKSWGEFFERLANPIGKDRKLTLDLKYSIPDMIKSGQNTTNDFNKTNNPIGSTDNFVMQGLAAKPITELKAMVSKYSLAAQEAANALNNYNGGIAKGLLKDGGEFSVADATKNFNSLQKILTLVSQAYAKVRDESKKQADAPAGVYQKPLTKAEIAAQEAARKKAIKDADDLLKAQTKLNISALESKEIADLSTASEDEKTQIIIQFEKDKLKVIEDGIAAREKLYKKGTVQFANLEAEKAKAVADSEKAILKETEDGLKRQQALQEKYKKLREDLLNTQGIGKQAAAEFSVTSAVYKGNETDQEAQKQDALSKIRRDALIQELLLVDIKNVKIKDSVERELTSENDKAKIINKLNELGYKDFEYWQNLQKKKLDEIFGYLKQNSQIIGQFYGQEMGNLFDSITTSLEHMVQKTGVTIEDWANTIKAAAGAVDEQFKQGSDARIAQLETEKQAQMDIAGSNATARLAIEKEFNDKIAQEKRKQARIDKAAAIFDIAINTAVGASKAFAQGGGIFGIPLAAIVIAFGAVQAALVAARPIPAFRTGTQNAPEGFARVAEDGPELIESRRGLRIAYKDQVTHLDRGDKVFTAEQTRKILDTTQIDSNTELHGRLATNLHRQSSEQRIREMSIAFRQDPEAIGDAVGRKIKDLPIHQTYFDERGVSRFIRTNGTRTKYLNDRTSLK